MAGMSNFMEQLNDFNIADVDWERVGVWPAAARIFLFVLAVVAILVGTYFVFIKDRALTLENDQRKEQQLKKTYESKSFEAANLDKYRLQMLEMEASFDALKKQLPKETEVPGLLEDIDEKGVDSRLSIDSITLQPEKVAEFYVELPIEILVQGGYHEFGAFVSGVAGMPRIVTLHDYEITKGTKNASSLRMKIQAKTYRYREQE